MGIKLREYPQGLAEACAAEPMQFALGARMERAKALAISISPVRTGRYAYGAIVLTNFNDPTGEHRHRLKSHFAPLPDDDGGGFHIETGVRNGKAYASLINTAKYAIYLEFGTRYMRAQHILGKAADALK